MLSNAFRTCRDRPLAHTQVRVDRFETMLQHSISIVYRKQLELAHVLTPAGKRSAVENCHCASPTSAAAGCPSDTCKPTGACTQADFLQVFPVAYVILLLLAHTPFSADRLRSCGEIIKLVTV
ncbi:hypothetical protein AVEN_73874-1 [Araneus ventricosus]|uniref:Uncharacterized protein n=1 Tax=Araneus ventricosus TaxID=182803 RepID=A0A4Y2G1A0_ARAVE|nr:hypothetical protein AVEN_73874-1 [Araneus ventricosus]